MSKDEIKPGDHITVSGVVTKVATECIEIKANSGRKIWVNIDDIKTHKPMKDNDGYFVKTTEFVSYKKGAKE